MAPPPRHSAGAAQAAATSRSNGNSLLVTAVYSTADISRVDVKLVDVASGAIVDQLDGQRTGHLAAVGGLICLVRTGAAGGGVRVFNPATGVVTDIPAGTTAGEAGSSNNQTSSAAACVFGQVPAATGGEYKVLRINTARGIGGGHGHGHGEQSCEILTLRVRGQRWRPAPNPPVAVDTTIPRQRAVAQGFAHFLTTSSSSGISSDYDSIASFDLKKETWRPSLLRGPLPSESRNCHRSNLSLVELNGCLVFVHHNYLSCCIDMWMLTDLGKGSWLRIQSLPLGSILRGWGEPAKGQPTPLIPISRLSKEIFAQPLMVLDDGRIAFWVGVPDGSVRVYDPKAGKCKEVVDLGKTCNIVGLCKGSPQ